MDHITEAQIQFGMRVGADLRGKSVGVARAMIDDAIEGQFHGPNDLGQATARQIELAKKFGIDISDESRRVGNAIIDDIMIRLNNEAIIREGLAPGIVVINSHDPLNRKRVISSIRSDGTVFFRGGNGAKAWARSLVRVDE